MAGPWLRHWLRLLWLLWLACCVVSGLPAAHAQAAAGRVAVPRQQGAVTDLTGTLTAEQVQALRRKIARLHDDAAGGHGPTLAVLLVPTSSPETIEQFATRVFDDWKPGTEKDDNGLLLLVALQDRRMRIEVGRGLEGQVPDLAANRIIEEQMRPRFRQQDFHGGIDAAVDALAALVGGTPAAAVALDPSSDVPAAVEEEPQAPSNINWTPTTIGLVAAAVLVVLAVAGLVLRFMLRNMRTIYRGNPRGFVVRWVVALAVTGMTAAACDGDWVPVGVVAFLALLFFFIPAVPSRGGGDTADGWNSGSDSSSSSSSNSDSGSSSSSDSGGSSSGGGSSGDW